MATQRSVNVSPDPRVRAYRQLRQREREFQLELATSQLASFLHLLCSELKLSWLSRSLILTRVALRRHRAARRATRKPAR